VNAAGCHIPYHPAASVYLESERRLRNSRSSIRPHQEKHCLPKREGPPASRGCQRPMVVTGIEELLKRRSPGWRPTAYLQGQTRATVTLRPPGRLALWQRPFASAPTVAIQAQGTDAQQGRRGGPWYGTGSKPGVCLDESIGRIQWDVHQSPVNSPVRQVADR
jgi:hypothetical protein